MRQRVYPTVETSRGDAAGWLTIPLVVDTPYHGYRLDRFLQARIPRLSRTRIQGFIAAGQVRRGGEAELLVRSATRVRAGELVLLQRPAPVEPAVVLDYRIVYRDDALLVLDKPAGLPVHPSARYHHHTLTALMRTRLGAGHGWEMAHRLDRETSGVMVFGRRRGSGSVLKRAFQERRVAKRYLALVSGEVTSPTVVEAPLGPARDSRILIKMGVRALVDGGARARTDVAPLARGTFRGEPITMVECLPHTGRQHQIRVHLAHIGHPVLGDKMYGLDEAYFLDVVENGRPLEELERRLGLSRQALHAAAVELDHPQSTERCRFTAPWPASLSAVLPLPPPRCPGAGVASPPP